MLEAPEERYAAERTGPRRVSATPNRKLRRDFSDDFVDDFGDEGDAPVGRLRGGSGGGGFKLKFGGLPRTTAGRVVAGVLLLLCLGMVVGVFLLARNVLLHDERFVIQSSSSIEFEGNAHVTRAQLLSIFGGDVERNIFSVPLAERRTELEGMPWVAHATVMRLLPNRMRVSLVERTPVAFVRQGSHIGLVDAAGVLLDMPSDAKGDGDYSFPVVSGISADDPLSTRAARMKIYNRFTTELDGSGEKISQELSEVDLSNPEDVKALIPDHSMDILVHFGDTDFLDRYQRFKAHLPEWRTVYPKLSSVDMRYERQVVLEMQPGSTVPVSGVGDSASTASVAPASVKKPAEPGSVSSSASGKPMVKAHVATVKPVVVKRPIVHGASLAPSHVATQSEVASPVRAKTGAGRAATKPVAKARAKSAARPVGKAKTHTAGGKHPPVVVRHVDSTPQYHPPQVVHP